MGNPVVEIYYIWVRWVNMKDTDGKKRKHALIQILKIFLLSLMTVVVLVLFLVIDLNSFVEGSPYLKNLKENILYIIKVIQHAVPIFIIVLLIYLWKKFATKWVIKIEKLDIGGASIVFEKPEELFMQQISNFLNTKRTLFRFDPNRDNISDTLDSFYKTYNFIREKMQIYDVKSARDSHYYEVANDMIYTLNEFLTSHQSNYRRWAEAKIKNHENDCCIDICEIQKNYYKYDILITDVMTLNNVFKDYAKPFNINVEKWGNKGYNEIKL